MHFSLFHVPFGNYRAQLETTSISSPQAKSPAGSSAGAAASASTAPGERTPTAHNKQLQNVKGQDHPPHPSDSKF
ncbi:hypothetical protein PYW08_010947 [Mythimna loreyi]|uniref:Uncharacterized protein n=1 Tax=Mythimna loreyi TaxID=667449 RepID=A0ACC2Q6Z6_9NEOP|nr:hypothetical protein PYW08_010947 [Mythimna loreyi]